MHSGDRLLPPVDITFGDFLRGVITADLDYAPEDKEHFRIVFIESFREWGIHPRGVSSMGVDALAWPTGQELIDDLIAEGSFEGEPGELLEKLGEFVVKAVQKWNLDSDRLAVWQDFNEVRRELWDWIRMGDHVGRNYARLFGLVIDDFQALPTVARGQYGPAVEIHAVRPTIRRTISGGTSVDLVIEITQRRDGYFDQDEQAAMDASTGQRRSGTPDFNYRAGATILVDPSTSQVRRVIHTAGTIADNDALDRARRFRLGGDGSGNAFDGGRAINLRDRDPADRHEPFALLHQLEELR